MKSGLTVHMAMANSKWEKDSDERGCLEHCINLILTCMHAKVPLLVDILPRAFTNLLPGCQNIYSCDVVIFF
jgi:hypothetical protein